jgi:hypothetical protein
LSTAFISVPASPAGSAKHPSVASWWLGAEPTIALNASAERCPILAGTAALLHILEGF